MEVDFVSPRAGPFLCCYVPPTKSAEGIPLADTSAPYLTWAKSRVCSAVDDFIGLMVLAMEDENRSVVELEEDVLEDGDISLMLLAVEEEEQRIVMLVTEMSEKEMVISARCYWLWRMSTGE